jgi:hypothetical protein
MADLISMMSAAAGLGGEYEISRSLRFNSADSAYLNRTPASASNRKTWTWSGWVKRSAFATQDLFNAYQDANNQTLIAFYSDALIVYTIHGGGAFDYGFQTTAVFRDPSAWYHVVAVFDSSNATAANRAIVYVNGVQQAGSMAFGDIPLNQDSIVNSTNAHSLGRRGSGSQYFGGYLTEIHFIDGSALAPTDFGEFNSDTGVWQPKAYTGSYGTNGFYLDFADNSGTTSTTLGADSSGNGNNWTPNNFSVTAGAGNDSLVDSPTRYGTDTGAGGEVRGNYATLNPLSGGGTLSNGNLDVAINAAATAYTTFGLPSGKWYWEVLAGGDNGFMGVTNSSLLRLNNTTVNVFAIFDGTAQGTQQSNSTKSFNSYAGFTTNNIIGFALDADNKTCDVYVNNTKVLSFTSFTINGPYFFGIDRNNSTPVPTHVCNFGQRPFSYTAPSGFKALCTTNLPEPTIADGGEYFNTVLYTGTGSSLGVTGVGFQPDWVWIKERSGAADHGLYDVLRGVQNQLESNTTTAETAEATGLTAFGTDGFTVGALAQLNTSADTYVAWNWKANGAGVSNTDGTITSTVSVNTTSGFSIVTYTGTGSAATVGHGLGAVPSMIIVKNRDQADAWQVYHAANTANPETDYLVLNTTAATADAADRWNDTLPTSTVFSIGNGVEVNTNTEDYVAYVFAQIAGYSAFGSYTGNGSTDGPFVYTGFRPAFVMVKRTDSTENWYVHDSARDTYNQVNSVLYPNLSNAEGASNANMDFTANGFKIRESGTASNASGGTYIYMAFASSPFQYSLAR